MPKDNRFLGDVSFIISEEASCLSIHCYEVHVPGFLNNPLNNPSK